MRECWRRELCRVLPVHDSHSVATEEPQQVWADRDPKDPLRFAIIQGRRALASSENKTEQKLFIFFLCKRTLNRPQEGYCNPHKWFESQTIHQKHVKLRYAPRVDYQRCRH